MQPGLGRVAFCRFIEPVPVPVVSGFKERASGAIIIPDAAAAAAWFEAQAGPLVFGGCAAGRLQALNRHAVILGLVDRDRPPDATCLGEVIPSPLLALIVGTLVAMLAFQPGTLPIPGHPPRPPTVHWPTVEPALLVEMFLCTGRWLRSADRPAADLTGCRQRDAQHHDLTANVRGRESGTP